MKLNRAHALLAVVDLQERLVPVVDRGAEIEANADRLIRGCHVLGVPTLVTEQYPKGLGTSTAVIRRALEETGAYRPIEKSCFSAFGCAGFADALNASGRRQVLLAGVEAHVCVYQTSMDLLALGFEVTVVADAVGSRTAENKAIALQRLMAEGVKIGSTEMVLFDMLVKAGTDEFKAISKLVK